MNLGSTTQHRLLSVISDYKPYSRIESGEAVLGRLRDDLDRPRSADRPPFSSLRELLDQRMRRKVLIILLTWTRSQQRMLRPVCEVADLEAWHGPAVRNVDHVFQQSRRHKVGFVRDPEKALGLLKRPWSMSVSFSLPRRQVNRCSQLSIFSKIQFPLARLSWCSTVVHFAHFADNVRSILCLLRSDLGLRCLDVCTCTVASEKGFAFALREGCRELASGVGPVSELTRF